jgi:hypothetical protein
MGGVRLTSFKFQNEHVKFENIIVSSKKSHFALHFLTFSFSLKLIVFSLPRNFRNILVRIVVT